ncbi:MAG: Ig-like domain-containing protein [Thermoplasmata archaeon]
MKKLGVYSVILIAVVISQVGLLTISSPSQASSTNRVIILVNNNLYSGIQYNINQYAYDLAVLGYTPEIVSQSWSSPEETRGYLSKEYKMGLVGAVMIGDIPSALYEEDVPEDFLDNPLTPQSEVFPIDLFYMDLDGIWQDSDENGIYDGHSGLTEPEIWVGRITATTLNGDEVELTNRYLEKVHDLKMGVYTPNGQALLYVDDDWVTSASSWEGDLSWLYDDITTIRSTSRTNADDYKNQLNEGFEWIHVAVHSSYDSHHFKVMKVWQLKEVSSDDVRNIGPEAYYYNLFACSAADYTSNNYIAGCYLFSESKGVAAIGSTKTGSMKRFGDFYKPLGEGESIGNAFLSWFKIHGESEPDWYYGLTIIGDPTIVPKNPHIPDGDGGAANLKPLVIVQSPSNNEVIISSITIHGTALDDKDVKSVWVKLDSRDWDQAQGTGTWSYYWDIEGEPHGSHTIYVRAFDGELYSDTASISITIGNNLLDEDEDEPVQSDSEGEGFAGLLAIPLIFMIIGIAAVITVVVIVLILLGGPTRI